MIWVRQKRSWRETRRRLRNSIPSSRLPRRMRTPTRLRRCRRRQSTSLVLVVWADSRIATCGDWTRKKSLKQGLFHFRVKILFDFYTGLPPTLITSRRTPLTHLVSSRLTRTKSLKIPSSTGPRSDASAPPGLPTWPLLFSVAVVASYVWRDLCRYSMIVPFDYQVFNFSF